MYQLITKALIPAPLTEVWDFFSSPQNLQKITPPGMGFKILVGGKGKMYPGQMIAYTVRPLSGIPITWITEITHVQEGRYFVDEQRKGPYAIWHHEHHFAEVEGGVEMTDIVSYTLPLGWLGSLAQFLFVKRQLKTIFDYRSEVIEKFFPGSR